jgi:hypothetical protein
MHRILLAFRAFFRILVNAQLAERIEPVLTGQALPAPVPAVEEKPTPKPAKPAPARHEALNLLAALQREARFVDFIQEPIADYSDAQIGAAVRDIHRDCAALLRRVFDLKPVESADEGAVIEVPEGFDPARVRLVGNVAGQPPFRGQLCHHGWEAGRCELPAWTGGERAMYIVAPAEVELK